MKFRCPATAWGVIPIRKPGPAMSLLLICSDLGRSISSDHAMQYYASENVNESELPLFRRCK